jgi:hypothetical protein
MLQSGNLRGVEGLQSTFWRWNCPASSSGRRLASEAAQPHAA